MNPALGLVGLFGMGFPDVSGESSSVSRCFAVTGDFLM